MTTKLPPRVGMPEISNMAHKVLSNRPNYHKIGKLTIKPLNEAAYQETIQALSQKRLEISPKLKDLKQILDDANTAYSLAYNNWRELAVEYERLDRKEKMLIHEQQVAIKANKPKETKVKSTEEISSDLAMKILKNLSPEKQAEILAIIQKQSS